METDILDKPFLPLDRLRILKYFSAYSLIITLILISLYFLDIDLGFLGRNDPKLYPMILSLHACLTIVFLVLAFSAGQAHYDHLLAFFLLDISLLVALIYSSGSGTSLSYLMVVGIAVGNALLTGQKGLLISAWGAIGLVFVEYRFSELGQSYNYVNAGTLGIIFFITAFVIQALVKRLHLSLDINRSQADSLLSMEQLTKLVLKRLQTGVLVLDGQDQIIFQNTAAQRLLGYPSAVNTLPAKLLDGLAQYRKFPKYQAKPFKTGPTTAKVLPLFAELMPGTDRGTVIFLEDTNVVYQQAQSLKQASLGKLTASIVREIREPMQNIYKLAREIATQSVSSGDKRRQVLIHHQMSRVDRTIKNIHQMSVTKATDFNKHPLSEWLPKQLAVYKDTLFKDIKLEVKAGKHLPYTYFDSSQMSMALKNIVENAVFYSKERAREFARVSIIISHNKHTKQDVIEVRDNGYGVSLEHLDHIYEPFFSSEPDRSGLGLYLAKQFCEMNMARLDYVANQLGGCFRITFAAPAQVEAFLAKREAFELRDSLVTPKNASKSSAA